MNGCNNFFPDVELAFKDLLNAGLLWIRKNDILSKRTNYQVVLESTSQYLSITSEYAGAQVLLIEKNTFKCIDVDDLLVLNHIEYKEQRKHFGNIAFEEILGLKNMSIADQVEGASEHLCFGQLYTYAKLVETVLYKYIFESKENWVSFAEQNNQQLYQAKIKGLTT